MRDPSELLEDIAAAGVPMKLILELNTLITTLTTEVQILLRRRSNDAARKRIARAERPQTSMEVQDIQDIQDKRKEEKSPPITPSKEEKKAQKPLKRFLCSLPADFYLSDYRYEVAKQLSWPDPRIRQEFQRFCDSARANDRHYKDWDAAWRNWVSSPLQLQRASSLNGFSPGGMTPRPGSREDRAERTTNALRKLGEYIDDTRGSGNASQEATGLLPFPQHP